MRRVLLHCHNRSCGVHLLLPSFWALWWKVGGGWLTLTLLWDPHRALACGPSSAGAVHQLVVHLFAQLMQLLDCRLSDAPRSSRVMAFKETVKLLLWQCQSSVRGFSSKSKGDGSRLKQPCLMFISHVWIITCGDPLRFPLSLENAKC